MTARREELFPAKGGARRWRKAAHLHAVRMVVQQNALSHQFPGEPGLRGRSRFEGRRALQFLLAENVAHSGPSAEGIHQQWMNSPPHRANLLDN